MELQSTDKTESVLVTETVHYCDYEFELQMHFMCKRNWVYAKYTSKELLAAGYQDTGVGLSHKDLSKVTCSECLKKVKEKN